MSARKKLLESDDLQENIDIVDEIDADSDEVQELEKALTTVQVKAIDPTKALSSGVTLLNLACTNNPYCFIEKGEYLWACGKSNSGKSFLNLNILASAANNPNFDEYLLIYDDAEGGIAGMDIEELFGKKLASRLKSPRYSLPTKKKEIISVLDYDGQEDAIPKNSEYLEEVYHNLHDLQKKKRPFIYVIDSMDSLGSLTAEDTFEANKDIFRKNEANDTSLAMKGSYGDGKAKLNSQYIRSVVNKLRDTGSILIVVSQVRDNITGYGDSEITSGGRALKFYAHIELRMKSVGDITKKINKKDRSIGTKIEAVIRKNRHTGNRPVINFDIYNTYGIDDLSSIFQYLVTEGIISNTTTQSFCVNFGEGKEWIGTKDTLLSKIEDLNKESDFIEMARIAWMDIISKSKLDRKKRFE